MNMSLIFILTAILVARVHFAISQEDPCAVACIDVYEPVCASCASGPRTFSNACVLDTHNRCNSSDNCTKISDGECAIESTTTGCPSVCTKEYDPVCAQCPSSGKRTFGNSCTLRKTNCESREQCTELYKGECRTGESAPAAPAAQLCINTTPVCASCSSGLQTFPNEYILMANNFLNFHDNCKKISNGVCHTECPLLNCQTVKEPVCALCGFQLRTFDNECIFRSYNCPNGFQCRLLCKAPC